MIPMTLAEIAEEVGGRLQTPDHGAIQVSGPVDVDSRRLQTGGLFVAVVGDRVDGHEFADAAAQRGAVAALGTRATTLPTVLVDDAVVALGALASAVLQRRRQLTGPFDVVALTGSAGKTSTKDLTAAVLATTGETVATAGNFNNEVGVPLTALRTAPRTRHLVLEMGARGMGHIAMLCRIAPPDVAAVLNVGSAHLGEFGSREGIARAKGEIVEALAPTGTAVLAADDDRVAAMAPRTDADLLTFGRSADADVRAEHERVDELGRVSFTLVHGDESGEVRLQGLGRHQVLNALAAAAMGLACGVDLDAVVASLSAASSGSPWRMEVTDVGAVTVVNDAYNANPESMRAALDVLTGVGDRRTLAVLGAMGELGESAVEAHEQVGAYAARQGVAVLLTVGEDAAAIARGAREAQQTGATGATGAHEAGEAHESPTEVVEVADHTAALRWLRANLRDDDVVLTKGSRSAGMETVALDLIGHGTTSTDATHEQAETGDHA